MKIKILQSFIVFFFWLYIPCRSQDILAYYKLLNKACYAHAVEEDYKKSMSLYQQLALNYPDIFFRLEDGHFAIESALKNNRYDVAVLFIKGKLEYGHDTIYTTLGKGTTKDIEDQIEEFKNTAYWDTIRHDYSALYRSKRPDWNNESVRKLATLYGKDIGVRNGLSHLRNSSYLHDTILTYINKNLLSNVDSTNAVELFALLKVPDEDIQYEILNRSLFLLFHTFYKCEIGKTIDSAYYYSIKDMMYKGVMKGKISNTTYASVIDRSLSWGPCNTPQYYCGDLGYNGSEYYIRTSIEEIKNVDRRRAEIGLPTLYETSKIYRFSLPKEYKIQQ